MAQASRPYSESDAHVIRRLESFSDIVIGFSLAEAALNLVIPAHPLDILIHPTGLYAYLCTFFLVTAIWWSHSQLFQHFLLPNRFTFGLCIVTLALTGLLVYAFQVWMHTVDRADSYSAAQIYFGILALTYCVMGSLFAVGLRAYRASLDPRTRAKGLLRCTWLFAIGIGAGAGTVISAIPTLSFAGHGAPAYLALGGEARGPVPAEAVFGIMLGMVIASAITVMVRRGTSRAN